MEIPRIEGLRVRERVAAGPCGNLYLAEDESGTRLAVKVFHGMAINRVLLARATVRLEEAGWPQGVMPVISADFDGRPAVRVGPWLADGNEAGHDVPRTLQQRLPEFPGADSWRVVLELAKAVAVLHDLRVAHGNLKPGNVFFDAGDRLALTDWALGNMPGVSHIDYTDAYLYQPPEQLRDPAGYLEEKAYRWDVFAFGVLAYRLLTGRFPRCHDTFSLVAPGPDEAGKEGIQANVERVARNLEGSEEISWPDEAANPMEAGYREWIERCLRLDPAARPATMAEVSRGFAAVEERVSAESRTESLLNQRRHAENRAWRALFAAGAFAALALVLGALWQVMLTRLREEKQATAVETRTLKDQVAQAVKARDEAEKLESTSRRTLDYERDLWLARLQASREIGDHLFEWAMEKGHRRLPPIDGREQRLARLERYYTEFLAKVADMDSLSDERARVRLQLAEVALARGNAELAKTRLQEALDAWKDKPTDARWELRIATDRLLLALLRQANDDPRTGEAFAEARKALQAVPQVEVDADRLNQLIAILDFHEAQQLAEHGKDGPALEQLMRATQSLNRLADQRPDASVLRSELASCYLSSATILEGMGNLGDAREVRNLAAGQLVKLLKERPTDPVLRLELAGCYGAMAEAAVLAGDVAAADSLSSQATALLESLLREQPDNTEALVRLGAQRGIRAGLLRDRGQAGEAAKLTEDGLRMLESARASDPENGTVSYRLALLWWQKARSEGGAGQRDEEMKLLSKARDTLVALEQRSDFSVAHGEQLQRSLAYLLGDLGHSMVLGGQGEEAKKTFAQAVSAWEELAKSRPQSEEYEEGLAWCRQRLKELP